MIRSLFLLLSVVFRLAASRTPMQDYKDHPCIRSCDVNRPMTCEYDFTVEYYYTLSKACYNCPNNVTDCYRPQCVPADGNSRGVLVVNRMLPGPALHVCEDDEVIVNVHNDIAGAVGISIHFHGVHQKGTPYMDGVGMLTQCPISQHSSFQYRFKAKTTGTHFWHDHTGPQRSDGIFGAFIVRRPQEKESQIGLYDTDLPEHTVLVNDWTLDPSVTVFTRHMQAKGDNHPSSILINGKGTAIGTDGKVTGTPHEVFTVQRGKRHRFRIISNGVLNCPIQVSIDQHNVTAMASDGKPFRPVEVESFNIFAGERFDVVVTADQAVGNYWIRARGMGDCIFKNASQVAILRYHGAPAENPASPQGYEYGDRKGRKLNPFNQEATGSLISMADLEALDIDGDSLLQQTPEKKFYLAMDFHKIDNYHFNDPVLFPISDVAKVYQKMLPQINNVSLKIPSAPPLTQYNDIPQGDFCLYGKEPKNCDSTYCECTYVLPVALNDMVEIIIIDQGRYFDLANHPMHLHGHSFRVVGMQKLNRSTTLDEVMMMDEAGTLRRNVTAPVHKDTVTIPDGGYTVIRFKADNPGFWFLHCHVELHVDIGMGVIVQVGDVSQMPKVPRNFPRCQAWKFAGFEEEEESSSTSAFSTNTFTIILFLCSYHIFTIFN